MPPRPLVHLEDDALPAPLFRRLRRAIEALGTERLRSTYQTTFWAPLDAEPAAIPEEAIPLLHPRLPRRSDLVGVEWWLSRMRTGNVQVDFHQDRDEKLALATGRLIHPRFTSVLFLNKVEGGALAVTRHAANDANPARAPDAFDFDLAAPRANRFVWFDGTLTHGVLDAHNQIPARRLRGTFPLRLAIIFNWWHVRPTGVPTFTEGRSYRTLRRARGARVWQTEGRWASTS